MSITDDSTMRYLGTYVTRYGVDYSIACPLRYYWCTACDDLALTVGNAPTPSCPAHQRTLLWERDYQVAALLGGLAGAAKRVLA